jgi:hypothetical protein
MKTVRLCIAFLNYEYQYDKGRLYPGGIVLENFKYGYSLIARLKEICA